MNILEKIEKAETTYYLEQDKPGKFLILDVYSYSELVEELAKEEIESFHGLVIAVTAEPSLETVTIC